MDKERAFKKKADQMIKEFNNRKDKIAAEYQQNAEELPQHKGDDLKDLDEAIENLEKKINEINDNENYRGWGGIEAIFNESAKKIDQALEKIEKTN